MRLSLFAHTHYLKILYLSLCLSYFLPSIPLRLDTAPMHTVAALCPDDSADTSDHNANLTTSISGFEHPNSDGSKNPIFVHPDLSLNAAQRDWMIKSHTEMKSVTPACLSFRIHGPGSGFPGRQGGNLWAGFCMWGLWDKAFTPPFPISVQVPEGAPCQSSELWIQIITWITKKQKKKKRAGHGGGFRMEGRSMNWRVMQPWCRCCMPSKENRANNDTVFFFLLSIRLPGRLVVVPLLQETGR